MKHSLLSLSIVALLAAGLSACGEKTAPSLGPTSEAPKADTAAQTGQVATPAVAPTTSAGATSSDTPKPADVAKADTSAPVAAPGASTTTEQAEEKAGEAGKKSDADRMKKTGTQSTQYASDQEKFSTYRATINKEYGIDIKNFKEQIKGGRSSGQRVIKYPLDQLLMGIKVEQEHTKDKMKALEISMDHLEEFPDYYTRLQQMEDEAKKAFQKP